MSVKFCKKCLEEKDINNFHLNSSSKDGHKDVCKECRKDESKLYYNKNRKRYNEMSKNWNKNNVVRRREIAKKHKQKPEIKFKEGIRHRIYMFMKTVKMVKKNKTFDIVGLNPEELRKYIENQFEDKMTWENYGEWHVDHRIPLSLGDTEDEIYKLCHYTNLQPMWRQDNLKKGKKTTYVYKRKFTRIRS